MYRYNASAQRGIFFNIFYALLPVLYLSMIIQAKRLERSHEDHHFLTFFTFRRMDDGTYHSFPPKQLNRTTADDGENRSTHNISKPQEQEVDQPVCHAADQPARDRAPARCPYCLSPACPGLYKPLLSTCVSEPKLQDQKKAEK